MPLINAECVRCISGQLCETYTSDRAHLFREWDVCRLLCLDSRLQSYRTVNIRVLNAKEIKDLLLTASL